MYQKLTLPNGVRIVTEAMEGVRSAAIGIWVGAGSRYEKYNESGSAHYIEHMLFKGTSRYTASELAEEMDALGGQINAYTTRDSTCFYARVLDAHLPKTIDILSDMFFDSLFAPEDVATERGIIAEEIDMYADTPEDVAAEQLLLKCFPGALGRPVLGRISALERLSGETLRAFKERNYTAPRIVLALAGSFTAEDVARLSERFSVLPRARDKKPEPSLYTPALITKKKSVEQDQLVVGFPGLALNCEERFAMQLFSGILGGNASSRLFQTVREKNGLCYSIYTYSSGFAETGLFAVSTAMGRDSRERAIELIRAVLLEMRENGVTEAELKRCREQVKASLLMSLESTSARMNRLGFGELFLGGALTPEEVTARYDAVTQSDILALARRALDFDALSLSIVSREPNGDELRELLK